LGILRYFVHNVAVYQAISGRKPEGSDAYIQQVAWLRRRWFELGSEKYEKLVALVREAFPLYASLLFLFQDEAKRQGLFAEKQDFLRILPTDGGHTLIFTAAPREVKKKIGPHDGRFILLPTLLFAQVASYLEESRGPFGVFLSRQFGIRKDAEATQMIEESYRMTLREIAVARDQRYRFLWGNHLIPSGTGTEWAWWTKIRAQGQPLPSFLVPARALFHRVLRWRETQKIYRAVSLIQGGN